ncbi:MAG TPA: hypothetical protein EYM31_02945 [Acidobacteria bacterium]|nr:hypothetical protein [Acidobacteriota bacterium]
MGLGTFSGVFTPSVLTILGIILFRRLGYVVGSAGLGQAILMLSLATAISVLTSLSLSAIATNRKVRGGGDYYLISTRLAVCLPYDSDGRMGRGHATCRGTSCPERKIKNRGGNHKKAPWTSNRS